MKKLIKNSKTTESINTDEDIANTSQNTLFKPSREDMLILKDIILQIIQSFQENKTEKSLSIISDKLGWLYSRPLPMLLSMIFEEFPTFRENDSFKLAFDFILTYMEYTAKEMTAMITANQILLRRILEASKISESTLNEFFLTESEKVCSSEFLVYLDSEIESLEINTPSHTLLVTVRLKILDIIGRRKGEDVVAIARIVSEETIEGIQEQTRVFLSQFSEGEKELFLQTLQMMITDIKSRYQSVDPLLIEKLKLMEAEVSSSIS